MILTDQPWSPIHTLAVKNITNLDVSPDGKSIAFTVMQAALTCEPSSFQSQVYLADADGSQQVRLTNHRGNDYWPSWGGSNSP